jgi:arginase
VGVACAAVHAACAAAARDGDFVLLAGGDHSVAAGSVSAALAVRPDVGVVWVDAHADINTPATSPSGSMHGMPVALLTRAAQAHAGREWDFLRGSPRLEPSALVYVGLRDLDPEEAALVRSLGILAFSMQDVDQRGIARVMAAALRHLKGRPLHLSFDVDAVDPGVIAATGTAVPGGLSYREAHFVCEAVAATSRLVSMDLVELNPTIGAAASLGSGAGAGAGAGSGAGADGAFSQAGVASTAYAASFVLSALGKVTLPKVVKPPRAPRKTAAAAAAVPGQVADLPQR